MSLKKRPYHKFENTKAWNVLEKSVADLVQNQDIVETTNRYYIVGSILKDLYAARILNESKKIYDK